MSTFTDEVQAFETEVKGILVKAAAIFQGILPILENILSIVGLFKKDPKAVAAEAITQAALDVAANAAAALAQSNGDPTAASSLIDMSKVVALVKTLEHQGAAVSATVPIGKISLSDAPNSNQ